MADPPEFPFLDSIIEEIWQGKRVVFVPPGTVAAIATNLAFTMGGALWCAAVLPWLTHATSPSARASVALGGIALLVPQIVVPAVMVARGLTLGRRILVWMLTAWSLVAGGGALYLAVTHADLRNAAVVSATLLAFARYCVATRSYRVFSTFQERMRARRLRR
jgi:hypothetical protein